MLTYTPQDDDLKPIQPYAVPVTTPPLPDPLFLREHRIWRHSSAEARFYLFYVMEIIPDGTFFCVYGQSFKQSHFSIQYDSTFLNQPLFDAMTSRQQVSYPTIVEAIAAFGLEKVANY